MTETLKDLRLERGVIEGEEEEFLAKTRKERNEIGTKKRDLAARLAAKLGVSPEVMRQVGEKTFWVITEYAEAKEVDPKWLAQEFAYVIMRVTSLSSTALREVGSIEETDDPKELREIGIQQINAIGMSIPTLHMKEVNRAFRKAAEVSKDDKEERALNSLLVTHANLIYNCSEKWLRDHHK